MTDCFIMIHVIIFFVGVTDNAECGNGGAWSGRRQHRGCRCWDPKKSALFPGGNLCSAGVCGLGVCLLNHCVKFPLVWGGILLSVRSGAAPQARLNQTPLQNLSQPRSHSKNSFEIGQ